MASRALTIAIVTHNSLADLRTFLPGQIKTAGDLEASLVVVDNASSDGSDEFARELLSGVRGGRVLSMGRNAGYAAAVNAALRAEPGTDLLLINPDVELKNHEDVCALAGVLEANPEIAVAAPRLVGQDGVVQPSARRFPSMLTALGTLSRLERLGPFKRAVARYHEPSGASRATTVDWVIGAAMLIRREACDQVNGWDERYFLYVEDVDFCRRLAQAGWGVAYVPSISFVHRYDRATTRVGESALRSEFRRHHIRGFRRLWTRDLRLLIGRGGQEARPVRLSEQR